MRILIADGYPVMRDAVRAVLESQPGYVVCAEAGDGVGAVRHVLECNPDVVVLGITMPVLNGLDAAKQILQQRPNLPIIVLSIHDHRALLEAAKEIGIKGHVCKSKATENLIEAIDAVAKGRTYFST